MRCICVCVPINEWHFSNRHIQKNPKFHRHEWNQCTALSLIRQYYQRCHLVCVVRFLPSTSSSLFLGVDNSLSLWFNHLDVRTCCCGSNRIYSLNHYFLSIEIECLWFVLCTRNKQKSMFMVWVSLVTK